MFTTVPVPSTTVRTADQSAPCLRERSPVSTVPRGSTNEPTSCCALPCCHRDGRVALRNRCRCLHWKLIRTRSDNCNPIRGIVVIGGISGNRHRRGVDIGYSLQPTQPVTRSEEHTSELQSQSNLVCR